jgi:hypothetical protein
MSKGAKAMVACLFPEPEQGKRETCLDLKQVAVSKAAISQARTIIRCAPDLVEEVKTGHQSLAEAYDKAQPLPPAGDGRVMGRGGGSKKSSATEQYRREGVYWPVQVMAGARPSGGREYSELPRM